MKTINSLLVFFMLSSIFAANAQVNIQSRVLNNETGEAVEFATVRLLSLPDSALVQGRQTDARGIFLLEDVNPGTYLLAISSIGYLDADQTITVEDQNIRLRPIRLFEDAQMLAEVNVRGTAVQMTVRGDTIEYNAAAFRTPENAVVEDLLRRLPGVEISPEGRITVQGQDIQRITVDGRRFFDDDIEITTRNLPADMIDRVQVLDRQSDMARLTGFEDDETERIINLVTRPNRRLGVFGNTMAGVGIDTNNDFRYDANAVINVMARNSQTTVTAGANNINAVRSGRGRMVAVVGGGGGGGGFAGGGGGGNGITSTQNFGINNNTIINDRLTVGGNGTFNRSHNFVDSETHRLSYLRNDLLDRTINFTDWSTNKANNISNVANFRFEMEWRIDSLRTLILQPNIGYSHTFSDSERRFENLSDDQMLSYGNSLSYGTSSTFDAGMNLTYSRRFEQRRGRVLTTNIRTDFQQTERENFNYSFRHAVETNNDSIIDQRRLTNSNRSNFSARVSFVEPLWNARNLLETAVRFQYTERNSNVVQWENENLMQFDNLADFRNFDREYSFKNEEFSNEFRNQFIRQTLELNYRHNAQNFNIMLGMSAQPAQTRNTRIYGDGFSRDTTFGVWNFAPTARFQYNFDRRTFLRMDYRGTMQQPSIDQMQPVRNNSNIMSETLGNPNLNPAFSHNLRMIFSSFNENRLSSFNTGLNFNATQNALVTNTIFDRTGKRYNQTVNSERVPFSISSNIMYNTPIIQRRLHFNTHTMAIFNQRFGYSGRGMEVDPENLELGDLSSTQVYTISETISFTFTHDRIELGTRGNVRYQRTVNNLNPRRNETWNWTGSGNMTLRLPRSINFNTDINYTTRRGFGFDDFDRSEWIWNASIDKTFWNNRATLTLRCSDILRQRQNIRQNVGDNFIETSSFNTLTSFFMLSFNYRINRIGGGNNNAQRPRPENFEVEETPEGGTRIRIHQGGGQGRPGGGEQRIIIREGL